MKSTLLISSIIALSFAVSSVATASTEKELQSNANKESVKKEGEVKKEARKLSEKGIRIVSKRVAKGHPITEQLINRVENVDNGYLASIAFYKDLKECVAFDDKISGYTPEQKTDMHYKVIPPSKKDKKQDVCYFSVQTITSTTDFLVRCELTNKDISAISKEGVESLNSAIQRFRTDGIYGLVSPSKTLSALYQSKQCKMKINPSNFK